MRIEYIVRVKCGSDNCDEQIELAGEQWLDSEGAWHDLLADEGWLLYNKSAGLWFCPQCAEIRGLI